MSSGVKISELTAASTFTGSEVLPVVQSSTTLKGSVAQITTYVAAATATLLNKTLSGTFNTFTNIPLSSAITGTLPVANGGTGVATYAAGDLLYATATTTLAKLAATATTFVLLSGTAPSWGKVALGSAVSGTLPITSGGTGANTAADAVTNLSAEYSTTSLAALKALTVRPSTVTTQYRTTLGDGGGGTWVWRSGNQSANITADTQSGIWAAPDSASTGASGAWQRVYTLDEIHAVWFGANADAGTTDNKTAIQAAIDLFKTFSATSTSGVRIVLPRGRLKVGSAIAITSAHGVHIEGAGPLATEVYSTGNYIVFSAVNDATTPLNKFSLSNLTVRGGGNSSGSAHGIWLEWNNHCRLENIQLFSCRNALNLLHSWQLKLTNVVGDGSGSDACYNGLYQDATTLTYIDNAVLADRVIFRNCTNDCFRIINGQGSTYTSCQAMAATGYGFNIASPPTGTVKSQWLHMINCLADTCTGGNWNIVKGNATAVGEMILTGCWTGNSGAEGMIINGGTNILISGLIGITAVKEMVKLISCTRVTLSGTTFNDYNTSNGSYSCVKLEDSTYCRVQVSTATATYTGADILETGTADNNRLDAPGTITRVGASSVLTINGTEYGSWTPTLLFGAATTGITYVGGGQVGNYQKLGNLVRAQFYVGLSSKGSATGAATLSGLPIASRSGTSQFGTLGQGIGDNTTTAPGQIIFQVGPSSSVINVKYQAAGGSGNLTDGNFNNNTTLMGWVEYFVA
jgi:hypothetical protein